MLKAYDYAEPRKQETAIRDAELFRKEKGIASKFVVDHPNHSSNRSCPICDSRHTKFIFSRWDVNYLFCNECCSIFVPVEEQMIQEYLNMEEMKALRLSKNYQQQAEYRRADIWNDLVMWAQYRIFRYLGQNMNLDIIDYGNRYIGSVERFRKSRICRQYELRGSMLSIETDKLKTANVILYMNQLQHEINPISTLKNLKNNLKRDGILILNTRLGSGFDILTLKGGADDIFPYEHVMLPSKKGLEIILERAGFELLEITTPGTRDIDAVLKNKERIEENNFFVRYLLNTADTAVMADFQQFLQKSGLSSFAQVIARKKELEE